MPAQEENDAVLEAGQTPPTSGDAEGQGRRT